MMLASLFLLLAAPVVLGAEPSEADGVQAAEAWLKLVDAGQYGASWDASAAMFRAAITRAEWERKVGAARGPLGKVLSRKLTSKQLTHALPGAPDGTYVVLRVRQPLRAQGAGPRDRHGCTRFRRTLPCRGLLHPLTGGSGSLPTRRSSSSPAPGSRPRAGSRRTAAPGACGGRTPSSGWPRPRDFTPIRRWSGASTRSGARRRSRPGRTRGTWRSPRSSDGWASGSCSSPRTWTGCTGAPGASD